MSAGEAGPTAPIGGESGDLLALIDPDRLAQLTMRLIDAGGENPPGNEQATVEVLCQIAAELGLDAEVVEVSPGRPNVTITLGETAAGPGLMFLGHSDVVPAGTGWTSDPLASHVSEGRIWGRGACDMKGGLASVLLAMSALRESGTPLSGPVSLVCAVDEEELGAGIRHYIAQPDSAQQQWLGCVVAEPTDLQTVIACRGDSYIELNVTGVPAHSGRPSDGRSAVNAAARIIELIRADHDHLATQSRDLIGPATWNVGMIEGGQATSTVPAHCHLSIDRRLLPGEDAQGICDALLARVEAAGITGDGISAAAAVTMSMPGFSTDAAHPLVAAAGEAVQRAGGQPSIGGWSAACDGGFIAEVLGVPTIVLGPGDLNNEAHQVDESVELAELVTAAHAYALLAAQLLGSTSTERL